MKKGPGQEKAMAKNDVNRDAVDRYMISLSYVC
jgi:hypothetical protein